MQHKYKQLTITLQLYPCNSGMISFVNITQNNKKHAHWIQDNFVGNITFCTISEHFGYSNSNDECNFNVLSKSYETFLRYLSNNKWIVVSSAGQKLYWVSVAYFSLGLIHLKQCLIFTELGKKCSYIICESSYLVCRENDVINNRQFWFSDNHWLPCRVRLSPPTTPPWSACISAKHGPH